ncbi:MAG: hypothetical protein WC378_05720 [Opitutaceae bacterium]|jgi:hypothetical protein
MGLYRPTDGQSDRGGCAATVYAVRTTEAQQRHRPTVQQSAGVDAVRVG